MRASAGRVSRDLGVPVDDAVELADLIWQLRSELTRAAWGGEKKDLRFKAEKVELELTVGVEKTRDPKVKVKFWVLDASAGSQRKGTTTQTIRLTLRPVFAVTPNEEALIGGEAVDDEE
jgi:hypothetical protein